MFHIAYIIPTFFLLNPYNTHKAVNSFTLQLENLSLRLLKLDVLLESEEPKSEFKSNSLACVRTSYYIVAFRESSPRQTGRQGLLALISSSVFSS